MLFEQTTSGEDGLKENWTHKPRQFRFEKGRKIIIPQKLRTDVLECIHTGQFGVENSKLGQGPNVLARHGTTNGGNSNEM